MIGSRKILLKRINPIWHVPDDKISDALYIYYSHISDSTIFGEHYIIYENIETKKVEVAVPDYEGYIPFDHMDEMRKAKYAIAYLNITNTNIPMDQETCLFVCNSERQVEQVMFPGSFSITYQEYLEQYYDTDLEKIYSKKRKQNHAFIKKR